MNKFITNFRLIALLLAFITLVVYLPVGWHGFVDYDDNDYVTQNPFVKNGLNWTDFKWAFTAFHAGNWHPLTWISHQMDCEFLGLNAGAQHFVNVLFHAANIILLFALLLRLTRAKPNQNLNSFWSAAFVAALFAWHPLHVESVAWIAERKDMLSTFFGLLALLSYANYAQKRARNEQLLKTKSGLALPDFNPQFPLFDYLLTLIFFALGLLSKPMLVTWPFVMLLLDFWPFARFNFSLLRKSLLEKIPFFLLIAISCLVTLAAQKSGDAVISLAQVPLLHRLENAPVAVADYLFKFFWPVNLCVIYPLPEKIPAWRVILSAAVLVSISMAAWRWRKSKPYFLFGWLWFLGTLMPVIGLVQVGSQSLADRYTYIPSIGFFIGAVFLAADGVARIQIPKPAVAGIAALILAACIFTTEHQLQFWRDSETLFRRAIAVKPDNVIALVNLGAALDAQYRFDEALKVYQQAERFETTPYFQLHNNFGNILGLLGRHAESLAEYQRAIQERPNDAVLHNAAGKQLAALGKYQDALSAFATVMQLNPQSASPHFETAKVFLKQGRDAEAVNELRAAVGLDPNDFQILAYTAHVLAADEKASIRNGQIALQLAIQANHLTNHTQPMVFDAMGMACAELGDFTNALACAQTAIKLATALNMSDIEPLRQRLERYQNHQPWRESFLATNAAANPKREMREDVKKSN